MCVSVCVNCNEVSSNQVWHWLGHVDGEYLKFCWINLSKRHDTQSNCDVSKSNNYNKTNYSNALCDADKTNENQPKMAQI